MSGEYRIAAYRVIACGPKERRYRFFCEASGAAVCTTAPYCAATPDEALQLAWEQEGKTLFNRCPRCGRLVCDAMFNADVCQCVDCAPWEEKAKFCKKCGGEIPEGHIFCSRCGTRAQYGEVWD